MPRNSGGTYSLPAGNPVVTNTTISSVWANTTLSDIATAMTDSLSRSGQGGMSAQLQLFAGVIGTPGLSWGLEPTSGLYRAGAADHRYSLAGVDKLQITTNGLGVANGTAPLPALNFISDPDTGIYRAGANDLAISVGGTRVFELTSTIALLAGGITQFWNVDGLVGTPGISFGSDIDTGLYLVGANSLGISAGGARRMSVSTTQIYATVPFQPDDGVVGTPIYSFNSDPDTGIYRAGANDMRFSAGGTAKFAISTNVSLEGGSVLFINDGSAGTPGLLFNNDTDTGIYRIASNIMQFSVGGAEGGFVILHASGARSLGGPAISVIDGVSAPATSAGFALIYVDTTDGDLKVKFGDGTVKTLATDT